MPPAPCPDPRALADLLGGRLSLPEVDRLAAHLEGCPACGRAAAGLRADDPLAGLVRGLPAAGADDPDVTRLIGAVRGLGRGDASTVTDAAEDLGPPGGLGEIGRVGGYRVVGRLGAGGMGVVYLARQSRPDRPVALKVLAGPRAGGEWAARFRAEAEVAARLAHPHIVPVYEAGEDGGRLFIAMEVADGGTLAGRLADAPLPPKEAAGLIARVARAVAFAHARGIVHRDLKPANVLLAADGTPKVSDFGLAKLVEPDPSGGPAGRTETGALLGTPAYMAPEQAAGDKAVGPAADIYGLGAVLYECLTGRPPFKAASVLETLDQVRRQDPVAVRRLQPGVPKDLETICLKCLEKDPGRRYATADELADDLGRFARGEPVRARPVGPLARAAKWARRRPTAAALVGVCVASAAALAGVVGVSTARLRQEVDRANAGEAAAEQKRAEAAANYRASRDAIRRILGRVGPRLGSDLPRVGELYRDQLEDALAFYRGVLAEAADPDPAVRLDAGKAYAEAGSLQYYLGRPDPAREYLDRSIALLEGLPPDYRAQNEARSGLIHALNHRAQLTPNPGADDEAEGYMLRAQAEHEARVRAAPGDPAVLNSLARGESNLALLYAGRRQTDRAEAHYARATAIAADLTARHPADRTIAADAAGYLLNLGHLYASTKRPGRAIETFRRAEAALLPLVDQTDPRPDEGTLTLVGAWINWGNLLRDGGDPKGSLAMLDRAVGMADALLAREPGHRDLRDRAYAAHGSRAHTRLSLGRFADAAADYDRVVELAPAELRTGLRAERAIALAKGGLHGRAAAEALDLAPGASGNALYNLACVLALAAKPAADDPALGPLLGRAAADAYAAAAVRLLGRLRADRYFDGPGRAIHLAVDGDLDPLRARTDFRAFIAAVTGKTPP